MRGNELLFSLAKTLWTSNSYGSQESEKAPLSELVHEALRPLELSKTDVSKQTWRAQLHLVCKRNGLPIPEKLRDGATKTERGQTKKLTLADIQKGFSQGKRIQEGAVFFLWLCWLHPARAKSLLDALVIDGLNEDQLALLARAKIGFGPEETFYDESVHGTEDKDNPVQALADYYRVEEQKKASIASRNPNSSLEFAKILTRNHLEHRIESSIVKFIDDRTRGIEDERQSSGFIEIVGPSGIGKSNIVAHLQIQFAKKLPPNRVAGYYFRKLPEHPNENTLKHGIDSIIKELNGEPVQERRQPLSDYEERFSDTLDGIARQTSDDLRAVIFIDALDEITDWKQNRNAPLPSFLPTALPDGVFIIYSRQPHPIHSSLAWKRASQLHRVPLDQNNEGHKETATQYAIRQLQLARGETGIPSDQTLRNAEQICAALRYSFVLLRLSLASGQNDFVAILDDNTITEADDVYRFFVEKMLSGNGYHGFQNRLLFAFKSLPFVTRDLLVLASGEETPSGIALVHETLDQWDRQGLIIPMNRSEPSYELLHSTFRDFLRTTVTTKEFGSAPQAIAAALAKPINGSSDFSWLVNRSSEAVMLWINLCLPILASTFNFSTLEKVMVNRDFWKVVVRTFFGFDAVTTALNDILNRVTDRGTTHLSINDEQILEGVFVKAADTLIQLCREGGLIKTDGSVLSLLELRDRADHAYPTRTGERTLSFSLVLQRKIMEDISDRRRDYNGR